MLSLKSGHAVGYLLGPVQGGREGYYTGAVACGEPPGVWYGAGAKMLGLSGNVDADTMEALYSHQIDPRDPNGQDRATWGDAETLGNRPSNFRSTRQRYDEMLAKEPGAGPERRAELQRAAERAAQQAVAFIDATFSAPKSVTVLAVAFERAENDARAAAGRAEQLARQAGQQAGLPGRAGGPGQAEAGHLARAARLHAEADAWATHRAAVEQAVMAGARAALDYLQERAGYSRVGHGGGGAGRFVDAHEFTVAQFLQHDSRNRDPQLHVHNAILNVVRCADGNWRRLDSRSIYAHKGAASAHGERVMEAVLAKVLGLRIETRPDGKAREIVGVPKAVIDLFSSRRRAVTAEVDRMIAAFTARKGREPSPLERHHIAQKATLATRKGKQHGGETDAQRIDRWEREARTALAGGLAKVAKTALDAGRASSPAAATWSPRDVIERALHRVGLSRATWTRSDLTRAISDVLPGRLNLQPERVPAFLECLTDAALAEAVVTVGTEPTAHLTEEFLLANGGSVYQRPDSQRYAARSQIAAEHVLAAAGIARGAAALNAEEAAAVVTRFAENGRELGVDQAAAVRGVLSSGAWVEVLAAAAGTGKSFVVGAIAESWAEHGRRTLGLAPSQVAAKVLMEEGVPAVNLAKWRAAQARLDGGRAQAGDEDMRLREGDLLVVDEAGMANTADLAEVVSRADQAGARVLLVGDPRQLAAVGPGGALSDVGARAGTYELTEVRRFKDVHEGEASLRLRDADPSALDWYDKQGRIQPAETPEQAAEKAGRGWLADTIAGKDSVLLVGDNETAAQISAQLRAELVRLGRVTEAGVPLDRDGTTAGVGDQVQARRNGWDVGMLLGNTRAPINRETYRVIATNRDGSMTVVDAGGVEITLPARYVQADVSLAYASTVHGAQGRTVDTAHSVVAPGNDAAAIYVSLTRGRESNTAWVVTKALPSDAPVGQAQDIKPRAARAVLAEVLEAATQQRGALAETAYAAEEQVSTMTSVDRLADGIAYATAGRICGILDGLVHTGALSERDRAGLAGDRAMGAVERLVRQCEVAGHEPAAVLTGALEGRPLDGARAPAQVLHARIRDDVRVGLSPRITSYSDLIPAGLSEGMQVQLGKYAADADDRRRELGARTAADPPAWVTEALGAVPDDVVARADWEHRAGWAAAHRENLGRGDEVNALGAAPAAGLAEKLAVWWTAHDALRLPDVTPVEDSMTDGALRARVEAYEREKLWAPRWVADELAATSTEAAAKARDAELWAARAATTGDDNLAAEAAAARAEAVRLTELAADLERADAARNRWYVQTAVTRDEADRSRAALEGRGVDVADPGDKVTADEWADEHTAEQTVDERGRPVRSLDVVEAPADALELAAADVEHAVETDAADIRDTSTADLSERTDPRREVPAAEIATQAVARSRDALVEIAARHAQDEARDAEYREEQAAWWAAADEEDPVLAEWVS